MPKARRDAAGARGRRADRQLRRAAPRGPRLQLRDRPSRRVPAADQRRRDPLHRALGVARDRRARRRAARRAGVALGAERELPPGRQPTRCAEPWWRRAARTARRAPDEPTGCCSASTRARPGSRRRSSTAQLRPVARGAARQGQPPPAARLGRAGRRGGPGRGGRGGRRGARRRPRARSSPAGSTTRASRCSPGTPRAGEPLTPIVVWQDKRSQEVLDRLADREDEVKAASGLPFDPYFSAAKLAWLLEHDDAVARAREAGTLRMGTVDSFLCDRLGAGFATDPSTASRTQLQRIDTRGLRPARCARRSASRSTCCPRFGTPPASSACSATRAGRPSCASAARPSTSRRRSPAPGAVVPGRVKATYGTGVFVLAHVGDEVPEPAGGLLPDDRLANRRAHGVRARRRRVRRRGDAGVAVPGARASPTTRPRSASSHARPRTPPAPACCRRWRGSARRGGARTPARCSRDSTAGPPRAQVARAALEGIVWRVADVVAAIRESVDVDEPAGRRRAHQRAADARAPGRRDRRARRGRPARTRPCSGRRRWRRSARACSARSPRRPSCCRSTARCEPRRDDAWRAARARALARVRRRDRGARRP